MLQNVAWSKTDQSQTNGTLMEIMLSWTTGDIPLSFLEHHWIFLYTDVIEINEYLVSIKVT